MRLARITSDGETCQIYSNWKKKCRIRDLGCRNQRDRARFGRSGIAGDLDFHDLSHFLLFMRDSGISDLIYSSELSNFRCATFRFAAF